ncbi:MAG: hypothetical protein OXH96_06460 [Spirochaetaceae bacterium]|nr:hypothetical protein [Spirochaetaceae bacterium]
MLQASRVILSGTAVDLLANACRYRRLMNVSSASLCPRHTHG